MSKISKSGVTFLLTQFKFETAKSLFVANNRRLLVYLGRVIISVFAEHFSPVIPNTNVATKEFPWACVVDLR